MRNGTSPAGGGGDAHIPIYHFNYVLIFTEALNLVIIFLRLNSYGIFKSSTLPIKRNKIVSQYKFTYSSSDYANIYYV